MTKEKSIEKKTRPRKKHKKDMYDRLAVRLRQLSEAERKRTEKWERESPKPWGRNPNWL